MTDTTTTPTDRQVQPGDRVRVTQFDRVQAGWSTCSKCPKVGDVVTVGSVHVGDIVRIASGEAAMPHYLRRDEYEYVPTERPIGTVKVKVNFDRESFDAALAGIDDGLLAERIKAAKAAAEILQPRCGDFLGAVAVQDVIDLGDWLLGVTYDDVDEAPADEDSQPPS